MAKTTTRLAASFAHLLGGRAGADIAPPTPKADAADGDGDMKKREDDVAAREEAVTEREKAVKEREEDVAEREQQCAEREQAANEDDEDNDENGDGGQGEPDDDGGDEDMKKAASAGHSRALAIARRRGRRAERKRGRAIFAHKAAAKNLPLAASLAFDTSMNATAAIKVLEQAPAAAGLHSRMGGTPTNVPAGGPEEPKGPQVIQNMWAKAFAPFVRKQ